MQSIVLSCIMQKHPTNNMKRNYRKKGLKLSKTFVWHFGTKTLNSLLTSYFLKDFLNDLRLQNCKYIQSNKPLFQLALVLDS